ncbi:MAG TPA: GNAT family N-acetyltransferase [Chthonomonadales bacterium]|nr:GNAT family N-acetyltransferase [Chthonomonadales bacterium]
MQFTLTRDPEALLRLRDDWDDLLSRSSGSTIYQTWEWNEAWWSVHGRGKRLLLGQFRDEGCLVGLAPLFVGFHLGTPLRRAAFLGTGSSDYLDIIADDAHASAVAEGLIDYLQGARGFDLADLQQLRASALMNAGADRCGSNCGSGRRVSLITQEPCPQVPLPATWDDYAARLGKKMRSNVAYAQRRVERDFPSVEMAHATPRDLAEAMSSLFDLHQRRWRSRLLPGVLGGVRVRRFHRLVAERFQARGWLRLHLLRIDGVVRAALHCFRHRDRYYYYLGGFDPDLARYSIGTLLTSRAIQSAIDEGCATFDFLRGAEAYKYRWAPEERFNHRLLLAHPGSLRARAMLNLNHFERLVEARAKAFAERRRKAHAA